MQSHDIQATLIEIVTEAMAENSLNQTELAAKSGVGRVVLSRILAGKQTGSIALWQRLLDAACEQSSQPPKSPPPKPTPAPVVEKIPAEIAAQRQREWDAEALRQQAPRGFAWDKAKTMEEATAPSMNWQTKEDLEKIAEHHHKWFRDVEE